MSVIQVQLQQQQIKSILDSFQVKQSNSVYCFILHMNEYFDKQQKQSATQDTRYLRNSISKELNPNDESYFHLIEVVGSSGRYQTFSLILWCVIWFIAGQLLLGTPFLLYNPPYENCPQSITQATCQQYVCHLPKNQRQKYLDPKFQSIATQFGDYRCQNSYKIELTSTFVYFGSFIGYLIVSWMNDNLGRRKSILIGLATSLIGVLIIATSVNLLMAQIGLLFAGFGIDPSINTIFYLISETVENKSRQKQSTIVQFFFSLAGIVNVLNYYIFKNWRLISYLFFVVPTIVSVFLVYWFIQETPQFMIMFYSTQQTIKSLKKVAIANRSEFFNDTENEQKLYNHIQHLKQSYQSKKQSSHKNYFNFWDIFRYRSIRYISIHVCLLSFSIYLMYYGPLMLLEKYNMNVFVSALVVTSSEILVYPIAYCWMDKIKRKLFGKILCGIAIVCSVLLYFIVNPNNDGYWKAIQMTLIFVFRFAISFYFAILLIYSTELFPAQIKGLAIGFASALGTVASTISPLVFGQLSKTSFPVMLIFVFFGCQSFVSSLFLPETLNQKLIQNLQQFGDLETNKQQNETQKNGEKQLELVEQLGEGEINSKFQHQF